MTSWESSQALAIRGHTDENEMDLTTPAVLFPAISLLLLAYTNRFLGLASVIRSLHDRYQAEPDRLIADP